MDSNTEQLYDEVAYTSIPIHQSHPDYCAVIATLHGLTPPPVDRCRVLELGCNRGDNLIPMALTTPGSSFTGIDLSGRAIRDAAERAAALGLSNVEFHQADVTEMPDDFGTFDYILVTGLHPAVPRDVQERIFHVCRACLAPGGIGFVTHAVYPGCNAITAIREIMRYHVRRTDDTSRRIQEARTVVDFLARAQPGGEDPFGQYFKRMLEAAGERDDGHLLHEYLADVHTPTYFHEFALQLSANGLRFLCDIEFDKQVTYGIAEDTLRELHRICDDPVGREQYLDYLCNRSIRTSLFARPGGEPPQAVDASRLASLLISSPAKPVARDGADVMDPGSVRFASGNNYVDVDIPFIKAALDQLASDWPRPRPVEETLAAAHARQVQSGMAAPGSAPAPGDSLAAREYLLKCFAFDLVQFHTCTPQVSSEPSDRPVASPLARLQARDGGRLTTLYHRPVELGEPYRRVLACLDGTRDRDALLKVVADMDAEGIVGQPVAADTDAATRRTELGKKLDIILSRLAQQPLLTG